MSRITDEDGPRLDSRRLAGPSTAAGCDEVADPLEGRVPAAEGTP